ncbi:GNAT family N-acetyltransferase [Mesobacillus jeotgali]|uniref:GNAT family N-acetyltransferase n=1 Tax=Mesobacillus jeotgali TaxID=129985 RepID=UPI0021490F56|nr:GNAT family N-acetyltransferase [Mesobacillus jeotgali]
MIEQEEKKIGEYEIRQIKKLLDLELDDLVTQSKKEGFRFVERLINDYENGTNTFSNFGEALYGVFSGDGALVAIGGLNNDPFTSKRGIGRLRRFYVLKEYRRNGIGSLLVKRMMEEARNYYRILVLRTDTQQGDDFYASIGFTKGELYPHSSHYIVL